MTDPRLSPTSEFDQAATTWEEDPARRQRTAEIAAAIAATVPPQPHWDILEYGCGTAALSRILAPRVRSVLAVDASAGMVAEAANLAAKQGLANLAIQRLDLLADPPPPRQFDLAVSVMALHHIADLPALLARLCALLRPGARVALADLMPEDGSFHGNPDIPHAGLDPARLAQMLAAHGLLRPAWHEVHRIAKHGQEYPVFLLTATRD